MVENHRRVGFTDEEIDKIADRLHARLEPGMGCLLTVDQQRAVLDLLGQKRKVVKVTLWLMGAFVLWVLKDIYFYIASHISFGWGK